MALFTQQHAYELRARFDGSLARSSSGGVKSWLGPMLDRARDFAPPAGLAGGPAPFGVVEMHLHETRPSSTGGHGNVVFGDFTDALLLDAIGAALGAMPPQLVRVLAAHYGPEPPGAEGLEPADLRGVLCLVSGKAPSQLKATQLRTLAAAGRPPCLVALEGLARLRLKAEKAVADAHEAYARARSGSGAS